VGGIAGPGRVITSLTEAVEDGLTSGRKVIIGRHGHILAAHAARIKHPRQVSSPTAETVPDVPRETSGGGGRAQGRECST
jgi:hypothetical protein